jgi:hypothetical protein
MAFYNFSLEYFENTAFALIDKLDRNNIFPPLLNDPEMIISNKRSKLKARKRTPNAFFICRMNVQNEVTHKNLNFNMRIISKTASILWKNASDEEKYEYKILAGIVKDLHEKTSTTCYKPTNISYNPYNYFQLSKSSNKEPDTQICIPNTISNLEMSFYPSFFNFDTYSII